MKIDIDGLTEEELIELNHRVVERLKLLAQTRADQAMTRFRIGERVRFTPDGARPVTGMLIRCNRKTVTIMTDDGQRWNVSRGVKKLQPLEPSHFTLGGEFCSIFVRRPLADKIGTPVRRH